MLILDVTDIFVFTQTNNTTDRNHPDTRLYSQISVTAIQTPAVELGLIVGMDL